MPFIQEAQARLAAGNLSPELQITIQHLLANGVGRNNPVPTETILTELADAGYQMSLTKFQTTLLAETRAGSIFIGSGPDGLYLIQEEEDAIATRDFYNSLIQNQQARIQHLTDLSHEEGWQI